MSFFNSLGRIGRNSNRQKNKSTSSTTSAIGNSSVSKPLFLCQPFVRTALLKGSFKTIVDPPKYVDVKEWLALNVFEFFNSLNQFYGVLQEFCSLQTCPTMSAGPGCDYTWPDANRRQIRLPAPHYIEYLLSWTNERLNDESIFPTKASQEFPGVFTNNVKAIYKQMFRVFAHIYHNHFDKILHLSLEAHWNSFFAHFISFGKAWNERHGKY
ncbi:Maintenance of ploidy protein mob2 [Neolecta irregularis DAH-3]|uniref:Maintenance of ploidy protein mob2 n=1 Tax=Neolecta irregularis (strain DAH-3) TaxID=1198029 RepID=A0A1U7LGQ7_NEOID|nr:Maintenance of ploidy protein mob2 [Neolecta irregularis DAH-3]|eukprot:OLL21808.1 Maintenance of ploidy protein mob2 [Neolecta irregularis DAH-3]